MGADMGPWPCARPMLVSLACHKEPKEFANEALVEQWELVKAKRLQDKLARDAEEAVRQRVKLEAEPEPPALTGMGATRVRVATRWYFSRPLTSFTSAMDPFVLRLCLQSRGSAEPPALAHLHIGRRQSSRSKPSASRLVASGNGPRALMAPLVRSDIASPLQRPHPDRPLRLRPPRLRRQSSRSLMMSPLPPVPRKQRTWVRRRRAPSRVTRSYPTLSPANRSPKSPLRAASRSCWHCRSKWVQEARPSGRPKPIVNRPRRHPSDLILPLVDHSTPSPSHLPRSFGDTEAPMKTTPLRPTPRARIALRSAPRPLRRPPNIRAVRVRVSRAVLPPPSVGIPSRSPSEGRATTPGRGHSPLASVPVPLSTIRPSSREAMELPR
jgi:hypothetical protein